MLDDLFTALDLSVGRIRRDPGQERALDMWIVADNLRKSAAATLWSWPSDCTSRGSCRYHAHIRLRSRRTPEGVPAERSKSWAMISTEVKRTLVKSAPELWSELSDPEALARHLVDFGEIRITGVDPEQAVAWEGEEANGTVELKSSGWGTKVTLTVNRQLPEASLAELQEETSEAAVTLEEDPPAAQDEHTEQPAAETIEEPPQAQQPIEDAAATAEPPAQAPQPQASQQAPTDPQDTTQPTTENTNEQTQAEQDTQPSPQPEAQELGAELAALEAQMTEESIAVLSAILDRLGAAHHRPFSRG